MATPTDVQDSLREHLLRGAPLPSYARLVDGRFMLSFDSIEIVGSESGRGVHIRFKVGDQVVAEVRNDGFRQDMGDILTIAGFEGEVAVGVVQ